MSSHGSTVYSTKDQVIKMRTERYLSLWVSENFLILVTNKVSFEFKSMSQPVYDPTVPPHLGR